MVSDVSPSYPAGGGERMLREQARHLAARGHDVRIVSRADPGAAGPVSLERERVRIRGFPVDRRWVASFVRSSILGARRATADELARHAADALHLHQPLAGYGALASRAGGRLPSLYSFYSPAPLEYRSRRGMTARHRAGLMGAAGTAMLWAFERACLRRAALVHVLSHFAADQLWKLYAVPRERIVMIPGAAETERFRPAADRGAVRRALGISPDRSLLFTVRNLEARMGLDNLLHTMAIVKARRPDTLLLIGGVGSLRAALEAQSRALGLDDHVKFLGFVPDGALPLYYQAGDVFILPTRELEGFGLVTVEALACGTPVLGTPVGATPEILLPLSPSLILRGLAPETMAEDIRRYLEAEQQDPEAHARLREACRRHVEAHYTWDRTMDALEDELTRLAARPAAPAGRPVMCSACGGETRPSSLLYRGSRYRRCLRCWSSVIAVPPTALELRRHYESEYLHRFSHAGVSAERAGLFVSLLDRLDAFGARPGFNALLLDVGCGGGHLLRAARRRGWGAVGTDLSWEACTVARESEGLVAVQADAGQLPFRDGSIGTVTLVNVVDQAGEPNAILREVHRVLAHRGLLAIRVPNASFHRPWVRTLSALGPFARWWEWDAYPIVHQFALTALGLRRLVERAGYTCTLAVSFRESVEAVLEDARRRGCRLVDVPSLGREVALASDVAAIYRLLRLIGADRPHIVHTHTSKAGFVGRLAARIARVPAVIHQPHGHVFYGYFGPRRTAVYTALERRAAAWCDRIITLTERGTDEHLARGIGSPAQYVTVPSGVPTARLRATAPSRPVARARLGGEAEAYLVVGVGRLVPIKGVDPLVEALPRLRAGVPTARVLLVGDGPDRAALERRAEVLGVADRLHVTGIVTDVVTPLAAADVVAAPSRNEGMGRALVEAMALGIPVVGASVGGIPAVVVDGECGRLVPPEDPEALARALVELGRDEPLREKLGEAAIARAEAFSTAVAEAKMRAVYEALVREKRIL